MVKIHLGNVNPVHAKPNLALPTSKKSVLFDKIVVYKNKKGVPCDEKGNAINLKLLNLAGSIAFTRDTAHVGWIHVLIYTAQKLHAFLSGKKIQKLDANMCHGMIITGYSDKKEKPNDLLIMHAVFAGIQSTRWNYLADEDVTEFIIYKPRSERVKELMINHAYQTAYTPPQNRKNKDKILYAEKKSPFSIGDMFGSILRKPPKTKESQPSSRTAYVIADLLSKDQLKNRQNQPRAYFCTAYAMAILQGSLFIRALSDESKKKLLYKSNGAKRTRNELAKKIYVKMLSEKKTNTLSRLFKENALCHIDTRYIMSCDACKILDKMSAVRNVSKS